MPAKNTHYKVTVNRPVEYAGARFRPGACYTVKAKVYDGLNKEHPKVIATADPIKME
jgi:hypothetical protein